MVKAELGTKVDAVIGRMNIVIGRFERALCDKVQLVSIPTREL